MIIYPVRAISFDVHGTLIHSPRLGEVYAQVLGRHGIEVTGERVLRTVHDVWQEFTCRRLTGQDLFAAHPDGSRGFWFEFIDRVCQHLDSPPPSRFAKAELYQRFAGADPWDLYAEVPVVLDALREKRIRMVVVSNWDDRLPELLHDLKIAHHFEEIVFSAGVGVAKPFAAIFERALAGLALPPEQVLHVGDKLREDVEGARGVGMQSLHLDRGGHGGELRDLRALIELIPEPHRGSLGAQSV